MTIARWGGGESHGHAVIGRDQGLGFGLARCTDGNTVGLT